MISGIILIKGVFRIRNFFRKHGGNEGMNTQMLMTHSLSFILYLVSDIVYYGFFTYNVFHPKEKAGWNIFETGAICMYLTSFISQVLLAVIFWDLGKESPREN